ncbi:PRC-barrel domain containing protein [Streptomyces sp. NPDC059894]|uniref:PRC-barrel domain containing protein n=1 Tax=unclassified Streptomyces TaxID=2593676 RepID=UPI00364AEE64
MSEPRGQYGHHGQHGHPVPTAGHTPDDDLTGYQVDATDGHAGKVTKYSRDLGPRFLVVHTGFWVLGKKVVLPSDVVMGVDHDARTVQVTRTKDEVRSAPPFDAETYLGDPRHRDQLGGRYGSGH